MLIELLRETVSILVGKPAAKIADILDGKKYVNEFDLSKKMELTINQVRNILYKLSDYGLVSSTKKKDKKKGWYTYSWRFEISKCLEFMKKHLEENISNIRTQIANRENTRFYFCERCKIEANEENALLMNYTCNECGEIFQLKDNEKLLKELKKMLIKGLEELSLIDKEISLEREKIEKIKEKENKKLAKLKAKLKSAKKVIKTEKKVVKKSKPKKKSKK